MNKEAEWAKTAPYCELHRPTRRYTHSNRNIVFPLLKSFCRIVLSGNIRIDLVRLNIKLEQP